jgi:hypothetical protein
MDEQPEPGARLWSAHLDRWVEVVGSDVDGQTIVDDGSGSTSVPLVGLMPTDHYPAQIGTHEIDEDGFERRTHAPPGEVCAGCSDEDAGRWVPVNQCPQAWAVFEREGVHLWIT